MKKLTKSVKSIDINKSKIYNYDIKMIEIMEIAFEDYKKKIENYIQQSVSKKEAERLMNLYAQELEEFYQEKLKVSTAGTLILQGY